MNADSDSISVAENLLLEPVFRVEHKQFLRLILKNVQQNSPWLMWSRSDYSSEDLTRYLIEQEAKWTAGESREYTIRFGSTVVGAVGLYRLNSPNRAPGLGYWLDSDYQGKGLVTTSVVPLIDLAFRRFEVNLIHINAATENAKSRAVATRIGMQLDGILRQRDRNQVGEFLDVACYSITRSEWDER